MPKKKFYSVDRHGSTTHNDKKAKIGILSEDVMSYYRNVSSSLEQGFDEDPDLKEEFLTNVYNTLRDEGIQVSQNQTVSRIVEVLFSHSKPAQMQDLFCLFCGELTIVVFDRFASHVFQALIQYLPAMYEEREDEEEEVVWRKSFHDNVKVLCSFMESHLRDVMTHTYGSHVLRSFLEALGGVQVRQEVVRSRVSRGQRKDNENTAQTAKIMSEALSTAFSSSFKEITEKLIRLCNFEDHLADQNLCPVLQTVMLILHKTDPEQYRSLVNTVVEKCGLFKHNEEAAVDDVASRLPDLVQNEVGSYLVELLLSLASESELQELYTNLFKKRIIYFAVHPIANYVLQKMLASVAQSKMMEELLADITPYLEDILAVNHIGIVTKLAEACRRTSTGQEEFIKALMGAFHCSEPEDRQKKVVPLLASLQTYETFFTSPKAEGEEETPSEATPLLKSVNIHGSLMLQQLLQFSRTSLVASSMVALSAAELAGLCCDRCGSHVVDVFFTSKTVLEKFKVALLKKLQGSFITIACNRNGSRCLENIWKSCALKQKIHIAEDLSKHQERLEGDQWGRFLYRNFALFKFSQRRKEWLDVQAASTKKQQLLRDIMQGASGKNKAKKRKEAEAVPTNQEPQKTETTDKIETSDTGKTKEKRDESTAQDATTLTAKGGSPAEEESSQAEGGNKKRKRKKGKKRTIRGEVEDDEDNTQEENADQDEDAKVGKKKKKGKKREAADEIPQEPENEDAEEMGTNVKSTEGKKKKNRKQEKRLNEAEDGQIGKKKKRKFNN